MEAWPAKLAQNLGKYDDLIFCPLDMPNPPEVDIAQFIDWLHEQSKHSMIPRAAFEKYSGKEYPWLATTIKHGAVELKNSFPELHEYLSWFPFDLLDHLVILAQKGRQSIFIHTDRDWLQGMRFYLTCKNKEGLHFFRGRQKYDEFEPHMVGSDGKVKAPNWAQTHFMDEPIYASFPDGHKPFMINSGRACHAVDANTCQLGERIAFLVRGQINTGKYEDLMARSLAKYPQHAIWY